MNKAGAFGALATLLSIYLAFGQEADSALKDAPPPKPPFVRRAPAKSAWLIQIKPIGRGPVAPSSDPRLPQKYLKQQYWVKSGSMMQCWNFWTDGSKTQDWIAGTAKFYQSPQGNGIRVFDSQSIPFFHDFTAGDFEMLDWIEQESYVGAVKHLGEPCYLFEAKKLAASVGDNNPRRDLKTVADFHAPASPTRAWISIKTGLPVEIMNGEGQYLFQFQTPPAGELRMPEPYASLWKAYSRH
jgi:hypothetical protein